LNWGKELDKGLLSLSVQPASAGLFGHMAAFAAGAVIAHETDKAIHEHHTNAGGVAADGRYAAVSPESQALPNPRMTPGAINPDVTQDGCTLRVSKTYSPAKLSVTPWGLV